MGVEEEILTKPIKGYEDYVAYSDGKIYSNKSNKFLKPCLRPNGYMQITLHKDGQAKSYLLHRIIAEAFLPNPNNLPEIDHIDCDPCNNAVSNLQWISHEDNLERSFKLGHQTKPKKLIGQYDLEGNLIAIYESGNEAERQLHIRHTHEVAIGKRKTAGGYVWKYIIGGDDLSE